MATSVLEKSPTAKQEDNRQALIEALYRTPGKSEIVNGEIIEYMATGGLPGFVGDEICASIRAYSRQVRRGYAVGDNKGFIVRLPNRYSFSPDAAYWVGVAPSMKFYEGAPLFAVEVRSESDYGPVAEAEMRDKRADYFAAGTEIIWDVDTVSETATIRKFTKESGAETPAHLYTREDVADAEPALPGFTVTVSDLFPMLETVV